MYDAMDEFHIFIITRSGDHGGTIPNTKRHMYHCGLREGWAYLMRDVVGTVHKINGVNQQNGGRENSNMEGGIPVRLVFGIPEVRLVVSD